MPPRDPYRRRIWCIAAGVLLIALLQAACAQVMDWPDMLKDARGFGYDIALYAVAALRIGRGARVERVSTLLVGCLLAASGIDAFADLWTSIGRPEDGSVAETALSDTFACAASGLAAAALFRFRCDASPLVQASWLNARNDVVAAVLTGLCDAAGRAANVGWLGQAIDLIGVVLCLQAAATVLRSGLVEADEPAEPAMIASPERL